MHRRFRLADILEWARSAFQVPILSWQASGVLIGRDFAGYGLPMVHPFIGLQKDSYRKIRKSIKSVFFIFSMTVYIV
jgi:hypothetical protein